MENKLIELINDNYTINEIAFELGLSHKELYYELFLLKNKGVEFKSKYFANADTILSFKTFKDLINSEKESSCVDLITKKGDNSLKTLVISDIHRFNNVETFNTLDTVYDYCIKNDIHVILNCGDLIEGKGSIGGNPIISDISKQMEEFISDYPFDPSILNFVVLGNHDVHPLTNTNQDFKTILENQRRDIIPIGYRQGIINVKDDRIILNHPIDGVSNEFQKGTVNLYGHSHRFEVKDSINSLSIYVPSLSNIQYYKDRFYSPQALELTFKFNNKYISGVGLNHLLITENKALTISEGFVQLTNQKNKNHKDYLLEVDEYHKVKKRTK